MFIWVLFAASTPCSRVEVGVPLMNIMRSASLRSPIAAQLLLVMTRMWPLESCERHLGDANDADEDDASGFGCWWRERSRRMDFFFPLATTGALFRRRKLKRGDRGMLACEDRPCEEDGLFGVAARWLRSFGGRCNSNDTAVPPLTIFEPMS